MMIILIVMMTILVAMMIILVVMMVILVVAMNDLMIVIMTYVFIRGCIKGFTLRELIFARINFREFREFWTISRKFLPRKI